MAARTCRPIVLIIRDGWGANPDSAWNNANAVYLARTPIDDRLMAEYPHTQIRTSGNDVGLPQGVFGNSEVGHQNIGAGRIVEQEVMRITGRIHDGTFYANAALIAAFDRASRSGGAVHITGLCSDGRVHSDLDHLLGLLDLSVRLRFPGNRLFVHAITDGRDTTPHRGLQFIQNVEAHCRNAGANPVASVIGRYFPMDRDNRWDRIERAYRMLVHGEGMRFPNAEAAIRHAYDHPEFPTQRGDEFIPPSIVSSDARPFRSIKNGDSVIFFNFRGDRPRQLTKAFAFDNFPFEGIDKDGTRKRMGFERGPKLDVHFVTMTAYEEGLPVHVAFPKPPKLADILGEYLSRNGLRQFRCAETEKYPHVTFFFNDYRDEPFAGEERKIIPSPRSVPTYDLAPEMSAVPVTDAVLDRMKTHNDDLIVLNYANADMVGHTGNLSAAILAVEAVDRCVGAVVEAVQRKGGGLIVTADHGNSEQMIDPQTGGPHTAHTIFDVECIVIDERFKGWALRPGGRLADIAPTLLDMLGLPKPEAMTGQSLLSE